jgi:hypothetical protein
MARAFFTSRLAPPASRASTISGWQLTVAENKGVKPSTGTLGSAPAFNNIFVIAALCLPGSDGQALDERWQGGVSLGQTIRVRRTWPGRRSQAFPGGNSQRRDNESALPEAAAR